MSYKKQYQEKLMESAINRANRHYTKNMSLFQFIEENEKKNEEI